MASSLAELPPQKFNECLKKILDGSWIDEVSSSADAIPDVESGDSSSNTGHVNDGQYNTATEESEVIANSGVTAAAECRRLMALRSTEINPVQSNDNSNEAVAGSTFQLQKKSCTAWSTATCSASKVPVKEWHH